VGYMLSIQANMFKQVAYKATLAPPADKQDKDKMLPTLLRLLNVRKADMALY
jgi:hypothetical protein